MLLIKLNCVVFLPSPVQIFAWRTKFGDINPKRDGLQQRDLHRGFRLVVLS